MDVSQSSTHANAGHPPAGTAGRGGARHRGRRASYSHQGCGVSPCRCGPRRLRPTVAAQERLQTIKDKVEKLTYNVEVLLGRTPWTKGEPLKKLNADIKEAKAELAANLAAIPGAKAVKQSADELKPHAVAVSKAVGGSAREARG